MTHEFSIGDIVKIRDYDSIPQAKKTQTRVADPTLISPNKVNLCGKQVEIVDRVYSEKYDACIYRVCVTNDFSLVYEFTEDLLEPIDRSVKYECEYEDAGNVIIANVYEIRNGERNLVAKGHGHLIHEGAHGFAQALSYALKRASDRLQEASEMKHRSMNHNKKFGG